MEGREGSLNDFREGGQRERHTSSRGLSISIVINLLIDTVKGDRYV